MGKYNYNLDGADGAFANAASPAREPTPDAVNEAAASARHPESPRAPADSSPDVLPSSCL